MVSGFSMPAKSIICMPFRKWPQDHEILIAVSFLSPVKIQTLIPVFISDNFILLATIKVPVFFLLFNQKIKITELKKVTLILTNLDQPHRDLLKITTKNFW